MFAVPFAVAWTLRRFSVREWLEIIQGAIVMALLAVVWPLVLLRASIAPGTAP